MTPLTLATGLVLAVALAMIGVSSTGAGSSTPVNGDVDCNGLVNGQDALKILRYQANLSNDLPAGCPPIGGTTTASPTPPPSPTKTPGNLPPAQSTGHVNANGKARVTISNDSRYALTVEFDGPEDRTIQMDACGSCTDYYFPPLFCPEKGPETTLDFDPGSYTVTVTTSDAQVGAYKGTWPMSGDQGYFSCFIVVKSFGY